MDTEKRKQECNRDNMIFLLGRDRVYATFNKSPRARTQICARGQTDTVKKTAVHMHTHTRMDMGDSAIPTRLHLKRRQLVRPYSFAELDRNRRQRSV